MTSSGCTRSEVAVKETIGTCSEDRKSLNSTQEVHREIALVLASSNNPFCCSIFMR